MCAYFRLYSTHKNRCIHMYKYEELQLIPKLPLFWLWRADNAPSLRPYRLPFRVCSVNHTKYLTRQYMSCITSTMDWVVTRLTWKRYRDYKLCVQFVYVGGRRGTCVMSQRTWHIHAAVECDAFMWIAFQNSWFSWKVLEIIVTEFKSPLFILLWQFSSIIPVIIIIVIVS